MFRGFGVLGFRCSGVGCLGVMVFRCLVFGCSLGVHGHKNGQNSIWGKTRHL